MSKEVENPSFQNENDTSTPEREASWYEEFKTQHGRPLRVLHIGNIANNAYLNSKILRKIGVESDVLCCDYYHIMACPEWEDADFSGDWGDDCAPKWHELDLKGFDRPEWFVQGPIFDCLSYLKARNSLQLGDSERLKDSLDCKAGLSSESKGHFQQDVEVEVEDGCCQELADVSPVHEGLVDFAHTMKRLKALYTKHFSERPDNLLESDLIGYSGLLKPLFDVFNYYDVIHAYATNGIYPLLVGKSYVAYEHGTLRSIPFEHKSQGRLCALTYKAADAVAITNCDAIDSVDKLEISNFKFIPHPINEERFSENDLTEKLRKGLRSKLNSDFVLFHPSRQHWEEQRHPNFEKGNDFFIRGFAQFVHEVNPHAACVMVEWGATLDESKGLIESLGITNRVLWVKPQPNRNMIRYIMATEVVADQFFLGAFGSTMPKALALGKPALLYLNEEVHRWCFDDMPPVLNVQTSDQIYDALKSLYENPSLYNEISVKSYKWYQKYHSNRVIAEKLCSLYQNVLGKSKC